LEDQYFPLPRLHKSPLVQCGCKKHAMDLYGDHTSTCTAHSGATKAHDWMVGALGPLFRTAGHTVRTQHGVTASAGQRRGDVEIRSYLRIKPGAGAWYSTSALPTTGLGQAAALLSRSARSARSIADASAAMYQPVVSRRA
jgi:hypothetical protein